MDYIRKEKNVIRNELTEQSKPLDKLFDMIVQPTAAFIFIIHAFYILIFLGLISVNMQYVNYLNIVVQLFICVILMLRFHPLRKHKLHRYDSQLIFGSAFFLLTNLGITQYAYYVSEGAIKQIPGIKNLFGDSKNNTEETVFGTTLNIDTSGNIISPKTIFGKTMGEVKNTKDLGGTDTNEADLKR
jgi:hypothetical protein